MQCFGMIILQFSQIEKLSAINSNSISGVVAVSWYPPSMNDENSVEWDRYIPQLLDIAHKYLLKVSC